MEAYGIEPQVALTLPILVGTDGSGWHVEVARKLRRRRRGSRRACSGRSCRSPTKALRAVLGAGASTRSLLRSSRWSQAGAGPQDRGPLPRRGSRRWGRASFDPRLSETARRPSRCRRSGSPRATTRCTSRPPGRAPRGRLDQRGPTADSAGRGQDRREPVTDLREPHRTGRSRAPGGKAPFCTGFLLTACRAPAGRRSPLDTGLDPAIIPRPHNGSTLKNVTETPEELHGLNGHIGRVGTWACGGQPEAFFLVVPL